MSSGQGSAAVGAANGGGGGSGAAEPESKRRRLLDAGGPVEDDETARQKMRDAKVYERGVRGTYEEFVGFGPDNVRDVKSVTWYDPGLGDAITPMGYFAEKGDLPMMRWLYVNGADTRDEDVVIYFPMWLAAKNGHLDSCKWLFAQGAAKDIKRRAREENSEYPDGLSPLALTFGLFVQRDLTRWLILNGALCKDDDSGELDVDTMKHDLGMGDFSWNYMHKEKKALLEWATDLHLPRTSFFLFLSGALSRPKHVYSTRQAAPLQILGGNPGIRELIGDYVGFIRGREARIVRQLTEMLPDLIE